MIDFGDGREERMDALLLGMKLAGNPAVTRRRNEYNAAVKACKDHALAIGNEAAINELIEHNPAYIRDLLESEDERFGKGAVADRYARTFYKRFK